jgi:DNA helicase II / ATP-dependent DNA helicase PcrA
MMVSTMLDQPNHPLLVGLNPAQQQAVAHGCGPLLVLAGAGSGKTKVLTHRIANILQGGVTNCQPVHPGQILSVTFTNKASKEMRHRIAGLVGEAQARELWMGTFHSICVRLLRRDIIHYQSQSGRTWQPNFVIYDESDSLSIIKALLKTHNLDEKLYPARSIKHQISELKNSGLEAYQYASNAKDHQSERLAMLFDGYEAGLAANNALDFDDLLLVMVKLLQQQPALLDSYSQYFRHILVDEFQDTNVVQWDLVRLLATGTNTPPETSAIDWSSKSLTVVGDVDQSIYSWRGADFRIILGFQKAFQTASLVKLLDNYRSTGTILEVANTVIANNSERLPKELRSTKGQGSPVYCYEATDERDEAAFVLERLVRLAKEGGKTLDACAVLYRTNVQSRAIEICARNLGIPVRMIGGVSFYDRREVKDVIAYLTVLFNEADSYSVKRVLNVPKRGIGQRSMDVVAEAAERNGLTYYQMLRRADQVAELKGKAFKAITEFVQVVERLKLLVAEGARVDDLIIAVRTMSGYDTALLADEPAEAEERLANLDELVSAARLFYEDLPEGTLGEFLAQASLMSDLDIADSDEEVDQSKLTLMTIHASKGLEFPIVGVMGMEEGIFPHFRSLDNQEQMEEERRLLYVAVTRAEDQLTISYARRRMNFGEIKYQTPGRFLKEIPQHCLTGNYSLDSEGPRRGWEEDDDFAGSKRWKRADGERAGRLGGAMPRNSGPSMPPSMGSRSGASTMGDYGDSFDASSGRLVKANKIKVAGLAPLSPATVGGTVESSSIPSAPQFAVGDKVAHDKFGEGEIAQVLGQGAKVLYNVQFEKINGKKLIDPRFAKLTAL